MATGTVGHKLYEYQFPPEGWELTTTIWAASGYTYQNFQPIPHGVTNINTIDVWIAARTLDDNPGTLEYNSVSYPIASSSWEELHFPFSDSFDPDYFHVEGAYQLESPYYGETNQMTLTVFNTGTNDIEVQMGARIVFDYDGDPELPLFSDFYIEGQNGTAPFYATIDGRCYATQAPLSWSIEGLGPGGGGEGTLCPLSFVSYETTLPGRYGLHCPQPGSYSVILTCTNWAGDVSVTKTLTAKGTKSYFISWPSSPSSNAYWNKYPVSAGSFYTFINRPTAFSAPENPFIKRKFVDVTPLGFSTQLRSVTVFDGRFVAVGHSGEPPTPSAYASSFTGDLTAWDSVINPAIILAGTELYLRGISSISNKCFACGNTYNGPGPKMLTMDPGVGYLSYCDSTEFPDVSEMYCFTNEDSVSVPGYKIISSTPSTASEVVYTATGSGTFYIGEWTTEAVLPSAPTIINAGNLHFPLWVSCDIGDGSDVTLGVEFYKRDTDGNEVGILAEHFLSPALSMDSAAHFIDFVYNNLVPISIEADQRLVVKLVAYANATPRTISFWTQGTSHVSYFLPNVTEECILSSISMTSINHGVCVGTSGGYSGFDFVTDSGLMLVYDGTTWLRTPLPFDLEGVYLISASFYNDENGLIIGRVEDSFDPDYERPVAYAYRAGVWYDVTDYLPEFDVPDYELFKVQMVDEDSGWVIAKNGFASDNFPIYYYAGNFNTIKKGVSPRLHELDAVVYVNVCGAWFDKEHGALWYTDLGLTPTPPFENIEWFDHHRWEHDIETPAVGIGDQMYDMVFISVDNACLVGDNIWISKNYTDEDWNYVWHPYAV